VDASVSLDDISQSIFGCPVDELTAEQFRSCQVELEIYLKERENEEQLNRL
jgi:hypothetical protein